MGSIASTQGMKEEAVRRLLLAGVNRQVIRTFVETDRVPFTLDGQAAEYTVAPLPLLNIIHRIEERDDVLIYYGMGNAVSCFGVPVGALWSLLYVPADTDLWGEAQPHDLRECAAYVAAQSFISRDFPEAESLEEFSEIVLERIRTKMYFGGLVRVG